jgi:hypothetical protein
MDELKKRIEGGMAIDDIASWLDELDHDARWANVQVLGKAEQSKLYGLAAGRPTPLSHYVPEAIAPGTPVRHLGRNTLPAFTRFEKRFMRAPGHDGVLWGYNHGSTMGLTGPGYFVVREPGSPSPDGRTDVGEQNFINYYEVPAEQPPAGWPPVRDNTGLVGSLVYGQMCDYMWRVSEHVSVGEAFKKGSSIQSWFVLCRLP